MIISSSYLFLRLCGVLLYAIHVFASTVIIPIDSAHPSVFFSPGWIILNRESAFGGSFAYSEAFGARVDVALPSQTTAVDYIGFQVDTGSSYGFCIDCLTDTSQYFSTASLPGTLLGDQSLLPVVIFTLSGLDPGVQHVLSVSNAASTLPNPASVVTFDALFVKVEENPDASNSSSSIELPPASIPLPLVSSVSPSFSTTTGSTLPSCSPSVSVGSVSTPCSDSSILPTPISSSISGNLLSTPTSLSAISVTSSPTTFSISSQPPILSPSGSSVLVPIPISSGPAGGNANVGKINGVPTPVVAFLTSLGFLSILVGIMVALRACHKMSGDRRISSSGWQEEGKFARSSATNFFVNREATAGGRSSPRPHPSEFLVTLRQSGRNPSDERGLGSSEDGPSVEDKRT